MKNKILVIIVFIFAIIGTILIYNKYKDNSNHTIKFSDEYTLVGKNNVFKYSGIDDITNTITSGSGIIFLGFPECPWCQYYVKYLNEVALENGIDEISYYNIYSIRTNSTTQYTKLVELLKNYLANDDAGNKKIFVPDVVFVKDGKIIANDCETSVITSDITPEEYWTADKVVEFKDKMSSYISQYKSACKSCN